MFIKLGIISRIYELLEVLKSQRQSGFQINTVIDVGTSNSCWSKEVMKIYPDSFYYVIEAQNIHKNNFSKFKDKHKNSDFLLTAAGNAERKKFFMHQPLLVVWFHMKKR